MTAVALVIAVATPALAQRDEDPKKRASALYELGARLFAAKQYAEAAKMFGESYELDPVPSALFNQARCLEESGQNEAAVAAFRAYLEADAAGSGAEEAQSRMLALERELEAKRKREADQRRRREEAERRAREARRPTTEEVAVDRGKTFRIAGYATAGGGAALMIGGMLFGLHASDLDRQLSDHAGGWTERELELERDGERAEKLQIGFMVVGGAAVVAGAALATVGWMRSNEIEVRPIVTPDGGGASVSLRF